MTLVQVTQEIVKTVIKPFHLLHQNDIFAFLGCFNRMGCFWSFFFFSIFSISAVIAELAVLAVLVVLTILIVMSV